MANKKIKSNDSTFKGWKFEIILGDKIINISREIEPYVNDNMVLKIKKNLINNLIKKK